MHRVLIFYITEHSGHHRAGAALRAAVLRVEPGADVRMVDAICYFNPLLARVVDRTYMSVIRTVPEVWDYLYDNPKVARRFQAFRQLLHRYDSPRLKALLQEFRPTVIACTQAFPCGVVADFKKAEGSAVPLFGVLTDFLPHRYWLHEAVDGYFVGSDLAQVWLERSGVPRSRIHHTGIAVDPAFASPAQEARLRKVMGLLDDVPVVLVMGGGQGLGPIGRLVGALDASPRPLQIVVVTGENEALKRKLDKALGRFRKKVVVLGHVSYVSDLMGIAAVLVTKPGGLTSAEALARRLPIVMVDPLPGQEAKNAEFLLERQAAVKASRLDEVPGMVAEFLEKPERLAALRRAAEGLARPHAALDIARILLQRG